jgi:hypothetical protein
LPNVSQASRWANWTPSQHVLLPSTPASGFGRKAESA